MKPKLTKDTESARRIVAFVADHIDLDDTHVRPIVNTAIALASGIGPQPKPTEVAQFIRFFIGKLPNEPRARVKLLEAILAVIPDSYGDKSGLHNLTETLRHHLQACKTVRTQLAKIKP